MKTTTNLGHRWSVILAGGDGVRLRPLTRLLSGDDRPKQFCCLVGDRTLLAQTRARSAQVVPPDRTVLVFTEVHERYYLDELAAAPSEFSIIQPVNRGTAPAILWSLMEIAERDPEAVVAFFPSDHHYSRERKFLTGVKRAFESAESNPDSVVILGAKATSAEVAYGWIETAGKGAIRSVKQFWEKPCLEVAEDLLSRRCLWNTFVMVGRVSAFLGLFRETLSELLRSFEGAQTARIREAYRRIEPSDFAKQALARSASRLAVVSLGDVGWSDLGDPGRAMAVLSEQRIPANGTLQAQLAAAAAS